MQCHAVCRSLFRFVCSMEEEENGGGRRRMHSFEVFTRKGSWRERDEREQWERNALLAVTTPAKHCNYVVHDYKMEEVNREHFHFPLRASWRGPRVTKRWVRKRNARLNVVKTRGEKRRILLGSHGNRKDKVIRRRAVAATRLWPRCRVIQSRVHWRNRRFLIRLCVG